MSANSRSRQKRKLEPISIEELAGATGMSGFCTFLTRDSSVPVPILDHLEPGAPESTAPENAAPVLAVVESTAPVLPATETSALNSGNFSELGAPVIAAPELGPDETSAPEAGG